MEGMEKKDFAYTEIDKIKTGMAEAKKSLVSSMVVTISSIKRLDENIEMAENLLNKFQV